MKGFVLVLLVEASQAKDDHASLVRVSQDFEARTVADLATAIELAAKSAQRQLRHAEEALRREREAERRRDAMHAVGQLEVGEA